MTGSTFETLAPLGQMPAPTARAAVKLHAEAILRPADDVEFAIASPSLDQAIHLTSIDDLVIDGPGLAIRSTGHMLFSWTDVLRVGLTQNELRIQIIDGREFSLTTLNMQERETLFRISDGEMAAAEGDRPADEDRRIRLMIDLRDGDYSGLIDVTPWLIHSVDPDAMMRIIHGDKDLAWIARTVAHGNDYRGWDNADFVSLDPLFRTLGFDGLRGAKLLPAAATDAWTRYCHEFSSAQFELDENLERHG